MWHKCENHVAKVSKACRKSVKSMSQDCQTHVAKVSNVLKAWGKSVKHVATVKKHVAQVLKTFGNHVQIMRAKV